MKFIHTFWSKPLFNNKFNKFETLIKCTLLDYAYSAHCVKKFGEKIILFADKKGAEILSPIPYDEVHIIDNLDEESVHFAAQIKFIALKNSNLGDVLIDGDLFLQKEDCIDILKEKIKNNDVVYSFFEPYEYVIRGSMKNYYIDLINKMNIDIYKKPYKLPIKYKDLYWMNTSLMGFTNQTLKDEYINQYYHHKSFLKDIEFNHTWPDIIIEQHFLTLLCKNYKSSPIIENFYYDLGANQHALNIGFTHLGSLKPNYNDFCNDKLKEENPQLCRNLWIMINKQLNEYNKNRIK